MRPFLFLALALLLPACGEDSPRAPERDSGTTPMADAGADGAVDASSDSGTSDGSTSPDGTTPEGGQTDDAGAPPCEADEDCGSERVCRAGTCVPAPPQRSANAFFVTGGAGVTSGGGLRLRLSIAVPAPVGRMGDGSQQLELGPLAPQAP